MQQYVDKRFALTYRTDENDKSYTTAGVVRFEENRPRTSASCNFFYSKMHNKKMFDLENEGQGHGLQHLQLAHSMEISASKKSYVNIFR